MWSHSRHLSKKGKKQKNSSRILLRTIIYIKALISNSDNNGKCLVKKFDCTKNYTKNNKVLNDNYWLKKSYYSMNNYLRSCQICEICEHTHNLEYYQKKIHIHLPNTLIIYFPK